MQCQKLKTYMETGRVVFVPAKAISPNPAQPRKQFAEGALEELTESIRRHGILQPLSVRRVENNYQLIAGERRLRAGIRAGLTEVPCIVMSMEDEESGWVALVENLQRQDLHFLEEARGIRMLMERGALSQEQAARLLGKSQSAVANKLRILRHSPQVLEQIAAGGLTERHARALLRLDEAQKPEMIEQIVRQELSVAETERAVEKLLTGIRPEDKAVNLGSFLTGITRYLSRVQAMGIRAVSERRETDSQIVLTITIPK